ncbi:MAG TPA: sce7725 family protein [Chitinophagaceae bacterium]
MYFPYLRCKQFELLALRETAQKIGESKKISPILEPVKKSVAAFERGIDSLIENDINFTIILNPANGEFVTNTSALIEMINTKLNNYQNYQLGIIINQFTNLDFITTELAQINSIRPITLIHTNRLNDIEALAGWVVNYQIKYNLYGENFPVRRYRGIITPDTKVLLDDKFRPQAKNADYINTPDEFFSDDHLYYEDDGFVGFSDFLTIGNDYAETGFLPYAVAIHLTYQKDNNQIWIRHFVSNSNSDTTDVAGKFGEALEKLIGFINENNITTDAANEFRELHRSAHYPGLGSLKKLSIKNHLELVHNLLNA